MPVVVIVLLSMLQIWGTWFLFFLVYYQREKCAFRAQINQKNHASGNWNLAGKVKIHPGAWTAGHFWACAGSFFELQKTKANAKSKGCRILRQAGRSG